jgi:MYXO-CTERM domain-containing protein
MKMKLLLPALVLAFTVFPTPGFSATCISDTLDQYVALGSTGCTLDNGSLLNFTGFSFVANNGSIDATQIEVTPDAVDLGGGFIFCATAGTACAFGGPNTDLEPFSGGTTGLNFTIGYDWNFPVLIDPWVASADVNGDPPTGNVTITETFCADPHLVSANVAEFTVCTNGPYPTGQTFVATFPNDPESYHFAVDPPAAFNGIVGLNFDIGPNSTLGALSATNNVVTSLTPEPVTSFLGLGGLTLIAVLRRRRSVG